MIELRSTGIQRTQLKIALAAGFDYRLAQEHHAELVVVI